jgi:putative endonuclease
MREGSFYKFWAYIIVSRTGTLYVGVTGYLARRIRQHKIESIEGFARKYKVHRLVYYETYDHVCNGHQPRKATEGLAPREEDCTRR